MAISHPLKGYDYFGIHRRVLWVSLAFIRDGAVY